ncbi:MAG TPA: methionyl-tRNA formyltransferase [Candidatus Eisenbacteria bacterium]|nr:methionyl-tRNA formyltransferase [Candidatus Eisenbacteria bacterium]
MRIVFLGTPEFAARSLEALAEARFDIAWVLAQPDRPAGRGRSLASPAVARVARERGLALAQPEDANAERWVKELAGLAPDVFVIVAYGLILSPALLAVPRLGALNVHASLLPDYRGASPIACAIEDGAAGTGVTTMWLDDGIDTGDMVFQRYVPIDPEETAGELSDRLAHEGAKLLVDTLRAIEAGTAPRHPQDRNAGRYCRKLRKEQGAIDWSADAERVARHVRAVTPWPGARTVFGDIEVTVERARVFDLVARGAAPGTVLSAAEAGPSDGPVVACGRGALELVRVKPAGKKSMAAGDWWRGLRESAGRFRPVSS